MAAINHPSGYGATEGLARQQQQQQQQQPQDQYSHIDQFGSKPQNNSDAVAGKRFLSAWRNTIVCGFVIAAIAATSFGGSYRAATVPQPTRGEFVQISSTNTGLVEDSTTITAAGSKTVEPLTFTALNFYHIRDGKPGQDYPWLKNVKLIEPYRETTLSVTNPRDGSDYRWEIRSVGGDGEVQEISTGQTTIVVLKNLDENVVTLEEVNPTDGQVSRRLVETVMVKYVRREIRTLTEEEKGELLDAMFMLWEVRVDGGNGKEIYGSDYADIYAMNRLHFKAATHGKCDHFHDGLGFLVSHSIVSNTFEFNLQLVNPKLSLPYWDFTIENSGSVAYDGVSPYTRTPLLHPSWFGTFDLQDLIVKDGRWAYTEVPSARPNNPGALETDIYGRLRSPWSMNDRKYLARGGGRMCSFNTEEVIPWPTCEVHYDLVTAYESFYDWVWEGMSSPHAPVHFWSGGVVDCASTFHEITSLVGTALAKKYAFMANAWRKAMFCDGTWGCDGLIDQDIHAFEVAEMGVCGCHGYDLTQGDDYKEVMKTMIHFEDMLGDLDGETIRKVVQLFCNGVIAYGDNGQSSSTLDPMFWPMHPTVERMWQFTVLTGKIKDFNWPDGDITITLPDGSTHTKVTSSYYEDCEGHRGSDIFPYGLLDTDDDGFVARTGISGSLQDGSTMPTNREVLDALNPNKKSLSYIYDNFKWPHCAADGYNFDDAWHITRSFDSVDRRLFEREEPRGRLYTQFKRDMADRMEERAQDQSEG